MSIFEFENTFLSEQTTPNCKIIKIDIKYNICFNALLFVVSGFGAVVKVVGSHLSGWGSIPGNGCSFLTQSHVCVYTDIWVWMSVNMLIKSFCYHYVVEKLSDIFTIIRLAAGYSTHICQLSPILKFVTKLKLTCFLLLYIVLFSNDKRLANIVEVLL